jgi:hypothetical protein
MADKNEFDFTIGADPEFCCVDGRTLIESGAYTNNHDQFGCDGNGITFEVRPEPSNCPLEVVGNIHDIFARKCHADKQFLRFNWKAGSYYADCPLGGHVHFGISARKLPLQDAAIILDNYVGAITVLIEHKNQGLRRREAYGRMGDVRTQEWGFEYRTCSSWITSPYIAAGVLCLSKAVMYEVINNPHFEPKSVVSAEDFYRMDVDRILGSFPKIWKDITSMKLYQVYKPYIDLLYMLVTKKLTWFPNTGMKEAWGLINVENTLDKIQMNVIWERFKQEINLNGHAMRTATAIVPVTVYR